MLGKGGMGVVYEAFHTGLDRKVALKVILAGEADEPGIARFRREAKVASKITHEHVVQIYDVGSDEAGDFIVMELVEGESLQDVVNRGRLDPERAIAIAVQMLEGLDAIHAAGIVHRDVKPSNVMLARSADHDDHVKLMDFGISKSMFGAVSATITETGQVIGTPQYMAPEQVAGADADHRADVYAVGLTLFAMLTGETPYGDKTFTELVAIKLRDPAPSLARHRIGLPQGLLAAVAKSLEREPFDRFPTAAAFAAALLAVDFTDVQANSAAHTMRATDAESLARTVAATPAGKTPAPKDIAPTVPLAAPPPPRRRWGWAVAGVVLGAGALAAAVLAFTGEAAMSAAPRPIDAAIATIDARSVDAAPDLLATAQLAERQGQLELALTTYLQAFEASSDPSLLFRVGELNERLDRKADAAAAFERYLALVPAAPDAGTTTARIQRLRGGSSPDAGVAIAKQPSTKSPTAKPPANDCRCIVDNQKVWGGIWLCRTLAPTPMCKCMAKGRPQALCPAPFTLCDGCTGYTARLNGNTYQCAAQPDYSSYWTAGQDQEPCGGYDYHDLRDPKQPEDAPRLEGALQCQHCAKDFAYTGATGDACTGYVRTGKQEPGHLDCDPKGGKW